VAKPTKEKDNLLQMYECESPVKPKTDSGVIEIDAQSIKLQSHFEASVEESPMIAFESSPMKRLSSSPSKKKKGTYMPKSPSKMRDIRRPKKANRSPMRKLNSTSPKKKMMKVNETELSFPANFMKLEEAKI
jgi:hypothetical protein